MEQVRKHLIGRIFPGMHLPLRLRRQGLHAHVQAAGRYGHEHLLRRMGDEHKQCLCRRFLHHLQERIGRLGIHLLRQIHHHRPVAALHRAQRQAVQDAPGLIHGNIALLPLYADGRIQLILKEIRILQRQFPELAQELHGHGLVRARHRKHKMDVRVDELLYARRAAIQLLQEVDDQRESPAAVIFVQQESMRHMSALHHQVQGGHYFRIPVNGHAFRSPTNWARSFKYCLSELSGSTSRQRMASTIKPSITCLALATPSCACTKCTMASMCSG